MNKLSDYIPLIVIVVSLLFTAIGKKKKPGKVTQETMLPGKTAGEPIDREKSSQSLADSYRKIIKESPKKQTFQQPVAKAVKEISSFSPAIVALESEDNESSSFSFEEEDLRKAIIYAEIINKKEW